MKNLALKIFSFACVFVLCAQFCLANEENGNEYKKFTRTENLTPKSPIYGKPQIEAIRGWGSEKNVVVHGLVYEGEAINGIRAWKGLGEVFTLLQSKYFALIFLLIVLFVPLAFFGHYKMIGQRHYNHSKKLLVFSRYNIFVHWCAALPFILICITGLMMVFGSKLGGGALVRFARDLHGFSTIFFMIFGTLMFFMWIKDCLPRAHDVKWFVIMGGYLDKINRVVPAHKFNAGQKMWFWVATIGGGIMVFTGAMMFFQCVDINTLRLMALLHNFVGFLVIAMLITHIYMAVFAIEGAMESIINGKMGEEEVSLLHSLYYEDLKRNGKLDAMRV